MGANDWSEALDALRGNLVAVETRANSVSVQLPGLCKTLEALKVDILRSNLENERRHAARVQGVTVMTQDKRKLGMSLGLGVTAAVLGGALCKDGYSALSAGLGTFEASLQELGKSKWAVSLDRRMSVVPKDQITAGRSWATWEGFHQAMGKLRQKALAGGKLGDLAAIVSEVRRDRRTIRHLIVSLDTQTEYFE